jgi:hypothetical protein
LNVISMPAQRFGFDPDAIISEAKVWRHWCSVIGDCFSSARTSRPSVFAFSS